MRKVAVFFGGKSCENEISILTGVFVARLLEEKYEVFPVYVHTDGRTYTSRQLTDLQFFKDKRFDRLERVFFENGWAYAFTENRRKVKKLHKIDVALNCCHGGLGEGGGVSALMEWQGIPFASPDLTSSGIFMDKCLTKVVMKGLDIPVVDYIRVQEKDYQKRGAFLLKTIQPRLKFPVIIKPARLGSSIGITVARNEEEAKEGMEAAFALDDLVLIEKYLENKQDINCAAYMLNGEICVSEAELAFGEGVYSFEEKYVKRRTDGNRGKMANDGGRYALKGEIRDKLRAYTKRIYRKMDLRGVVRFDFLVSQEDVYLCEVNTVPGSLAYYLFCERLTDAKQFFSDLVEEGLRLKKEEKRLVSGGILRTVPWQSK